MRAPSANRREVFGESHEGQAVLYNEPLVRRASARCAYLVAKEGGLPPYGRGGGEPPPHTLVAWGGGTLLDFTREESTPP